MESKLLLSKLSATLWWTSFWNLDCYLVKSSATLWWSPLWNQNCYLSNLKPHCDEFHYVTKYCTVILFCYSKFVVTNSTFEWFYALMNSCNMFFQVTIQEKTFCHKFHIWFFPSCTDSICLTNADFKRKLLYLFPLMNWWNVTCEIGVVVTYIALKFFSATLFENTARPRDTRPWGARTLEIHGF